MRKKYWKNGCVIATLLCLTACGKAQTGEITPLADNMIHLYLAEDNTVVRADADYQLKTPGCDRVLRGGCNDGTYSTGNIEDRSLQLYDGRG